MFQEAARPRCRSRHSVATSTGSGALASALGRSPSSHRTSRCRQACCGLPGVFLPTPMTSCHTERWPKVAGNGVTANAEYGVGLDIAELVRLATDGDLWAWERLINQYGRLIWATTHDFKLAESDAADVVQATWLRLVENIHRLEYPERVGSWLTATARHECLRSLTARKRIV